MCSSMHELEEVYHTQTYFVFDVYMHELVLAQTLLSASIRRNNHFLNLNSKLRFLFLKKELVIEIDVSKNDKRY